VRLSGVQSIKNNKLCKTNPIFRESELNLSYYITNGYGNKLPLLQMQKQTQFKPNSNPILPAVASAKAGKAKFWAF
jgi:hypothetical protein